MKLFVAVEIEADRISLFDGQWYCGDNCQWNDSGTYCQLFRKEMTKRLSECILARVEVAK